MTETLQKIEENRNENLKLLKQKKSLIIKQISAAKSKVLKYLDDIEERLILQQMQNSYKVVTTSNFVSRSMRKICYLRGTFHIMNTF
jgi:hypothetical protein